MLKIKQYSFFKGLSLKKCVAEGCYSSLSRIVKGTAQAGPEQTPSSLMCWLSRLRGEKASFSFWPQARINAFWRPSSSLAHRWWWPCTPEVAPGCQGNIPWLAGCCRAAGSGVLRACWRAQEIPLLLRSLLMCPVTGLEVASLMLPHPFSYTRDAKIMTGIWYHLVSACGGACSSFSGIRDKPFSFLGSHRAALVQMNRIPCNKVLPQPFCWRSVNLGNTALLRRAITNEAKAYCQWHRTLLRSHCRSASPHSLGVLRCRNTLCR